MSGSTTDLAEEFPGWKVETDPGSGHLRASRDTGPASPMELTAPTYGELRAQLDEVDAVDCRAAILDLCTALRERGLEAEVYGLTVRTKTRTGIGRTVYARRGVYSWTSGVELGPIGDADAIANKMLPGLGLQA